MHINIKDNYIYGRVLTLMVASILVFVSCDNSQVSNSINKDVIASEIEGEAISPDDIMDPEDHILNLEDIDVEKYRVGNSGFRPVKMSAGDTSSTGFDIQVLGTLTNGNTSYGRGIANSGHATGYSYTGKARHAFWWDGNGMQDLGSLLPGSRNDISVGLAINNSDQVVGYSNHNGWQYHPILWEPGGGLRDLGSLDPSYHFDYGTARDINDHGQVVGWTRTSTGNKAFIWDAANGMQDMGTIAGTKYAQATAINNNGLAVGYYMKKIDRYTRHYRVFTYDANTATLTDLGFLGQNLGGSSGGIRTEDINDKGQIVGYAWGMSGSKEGSFIWDPAGGFTYLPKPAFANSQPLQVFGVNNKGQVVGYAEERFFMFSGYRPFVWDADNGLQALGVLDENASTWHYAAIARDINDDGDIIGESLNKDGYTRAVIWSTQGSNNQPPVANAGLDQMVECAGALTSAVLDGSNSSDPDGDALTYSWSLNGTEIATGKNPAVNLDHNTHTITLTVTDPSGEIDTDTVVIEIVDTTPPELAYTVENTELWPPNHKMKIAVSGISITDICDPNPMLSINVSSNEAVNGKGDGNTNTDWEVADNGDGTFDVYVRAERSGNGDGRIYTITMTGTDASGNVTEEIEEVTVPHDKGNGRRAR